MAPARKVEPVAGHNPVHTPATVPAPVAPDKTSAPPALSLAVLASALPQSCQLEEVEAGVRAALPAGTELRKDDASPVAVLVWTTSGSRVPWLELHEWLVEATKGALRCSALLRRFDAVRTSARAAPRCASPTDFPALRQDARRGAVQPPQRVL
jgi:hypothetical protein